MRIGELAARSGVDAQTIRYYERIGLLPAPKRTQSRYRVYGEEDERRLRFVRSARGVGLSLGEVREVLASREHGECPCGYVTETLARRAAEIERQIAELSAFKLEIELLLERARERPEGESRTRGYCRIIETREHVHGSRS